MKNSFKVLVLLGVIILMSFTKDKCDILKNSNFKYRNAKKDVLVMFEKDKHTEFHNNKEHFIKSDIEWVSSCEYYLIIRESNLPNFPFKMGTKMHIVVDNVKGNKVYYTSSLGGRSWEGKMTKIKK